MNNKPMVFAVLIYKKALNSEILNAIFADYEAAEIYGNILMAELHAKGDMVAVSVEPFELDGRIPEDFMEEDDE